MLLAKQQPRRPCAPPTRACQRHPHRQCVGSSLPAPSASSPRRSTAQTSYRTGTTRPPAPASLAHERRVRAHPEPHPHPQQQAAGDQEAGVPTLRHKAVQLGGALLLGALWAMGRSAAPAAAGMLRPSDQHLQTVVALPQAGVAAAPVGSSESDSCALLVAVCLGFWMLSATISAGIGAVMKLAGRPMASGGGSAGWTSAGVMDTLDIMQLPLAYEEVPGGGGTASSVTYAPWEGPRAYIPVQMVKVFQPGHLEAGLVVRQSMLQPQQGDGLSIVSVTQRAGTARGGDGGNGNGSRSNGGSSSSDGGGGSESGGGESG